MQLYAMNERVSLVLFHLPTLGSSRYLENNVMVLTLARFCHGLFILYTISYKQKVCTLSFKSKKSGRVTHFAATNLRQSRQICLLALNTPGRQVHEESKSAHCVLFCL